MKTTDKPIANPLAVLREEFDDWAVLFNPETADAVGVNPVGVAIWKRMDGNRTIEQIAAEIEQEFPNPPDAVSHEVEAFIDKLATNGFVGTAQ